MSLVMSHTICNSYYEIFNKPPCIPALSDSMKITTYSTQDSAPPLVFAARRILNIEAFLMGQETCVKAVYKAKTGKAI